MKRESELNTVISHSLDTGFKIPDTFSANGHHSKLPFDGIGIYKDRMVVWEAKLLKEPKAFPWSRLEDHQIASLQAYGKCYGVVPLFLVGVVFDRGDIRVFYWTDMVSLARLRESGVNLRKKDWLSMTNYVQIHKGKIDFDRILTK